MEDSACKIIKRGDKTHTEPVRDLYCHKTLGGCGCVFEAPCRLIVHKHDDDGDFLGYYVKCPQCAIPIRCAHDTPTNGMYGDSSQQ